MKFLTLLPGRLGRRQSRSPLVVQSLVFAAAGVVVSILAAVSTALLARHFSSATFGNFIFAMAFIEFVALFFEFGFSLPAARLAASSTSTETQRRVIGAALSLFAPIGLMFSLTVFAASFFVDDIFNVHASHALRIGAILAFVVPFRHVAVSVAQGLDRLHTYSISTALAQALFAAALATLFAADLSYSLHIAVLLQLAAIFVAWLVFAAWLRPSFGRVKRWIATVARETRAYGLHAYLGRVLSIGTYNMDLLMLGAFTSSRTVGYYALAGSVAYAAALPVTGLTTTVFARMIHDTSIDPRLIRFTWIAGGVLALTAAGLAYPVIPLIFSSRYSAAAPLVFPLALAQTLRGVTALYNSFLSAHARGRELRKTGLVLTLSNLVLNVALIPPFGAQGAAWASFAALLVNLSAHMLFYRRTQVDESGRSNTLTGVHV